MWLFENREITSIEDVPTNAQGFIYRIVHIPTGKAYIGKKILFNNVKKKLTKKELEEYDKPGRKPTSKRVVKESDWMKYYGSCKPLQQLVKQEGPDNFVREILRFVPNKKMMTYYETKELFINEVLEHPDRYFNDCILGKFYNRDVLPNPLSH